MKTFSVELIVETDDYSENGEFIKERLVDSFNSFYGYYVTNISATLIDESEEEE